MAEINKKGAGRYVSRGVYFLKKLLRWVGWGVLSVIIFIIGLFVFFNLPTSTERQDVLAGITFSYRQAEALGLDWKETYTALLDDMGAREIRLPVYWNVTEPNENEFDYSATDWLLDEAAKRNAHVVLTVGQRVPRWPECHIPEWAKGDDALRKERVVDFVARTIERYKQRPEIETWQIENEAFLPFFGECPTLDVAVIDREIAAARATDPVRPILMSDSGELSTWMQAAARGDIFGTTMYRDIYKPGIGYYRYPIGPNFFKFKEWLVRLFTGQKNFYVIELQAEPWGPGWIGSMPLDEQFKTMDETKLTDTFRYAQRVGFPRIYLWGAEWWYFLKEKQHYGAVWESAKKIFAEYGDRNAVREDVRDVSFGEQNVSARVADTPDTQARGLSGTDTLGENEGMLFLFERAEKYGFWMKEMQYAIDIVWMDANKSIVGEQRCVDPDSYPKTWYPPVPARFVLEVPCGWIDRSGVQKGDVGEWKDKETR